MRSRAGNSLPGRPRRAARSPIPFESGTRTDSAIEVDQPQLSLPDEPRRSRIRIGRVGGTGDILESCDDLGDPERRGPADGIGKRPDSTEQLQFERAESHGTGKLPNRRHRLRGVVGPALPRPQGGGRQQGTHDLVPNWLGALDGLVERLAAGGRIADLGCGLGWSTIALARRIPAAEVIGWDSDPASIDTARDNAAEAGVLARFEVADAATVIDQGPYDLVTILEALHDMSQPVTVLETARNSLAPGGVVVVADEKVAEAFTAPGDELERMMYGWSVTHCLPAALAERPSAAIGTVLRESTLRDMAARAGFASVETLDVDAGFFRLYVLR